MEAGFTPNLPNLAGPISQDDLSSLSESLTRGLTMVRDQILRPDRHKVPPTFTVGQAADLLAIPEAELRYRSAGPTPTLPAFDRVGETKRLRYSAESVAAAARILNPDLVRPQGQEALVVALTNFKGGVGKTTSSINIAHALALQGYRVLCIDLDPQSSLTAMFGVLSSVEVDDEGTALPMFAGLEKSPETLLLDYAIRQTYWPAIDLVPSRTTLFAADFYLPSNQAKFKDLRLPYQYWNVLNMGLEAARQTYDFIIIDTPPSLSYITTNAAFAADGMLMPLPPQLLDFASSAEFWALLVELGDTIRRFGAPPKEWQFINVFFSMSRKADAKRRDYAADTVSHWIRSLYGEALLPVAISDQVAVSSSTSNFSSAFESPIDNANSRRQQATLASQYMDLARYVQSMALRKWGAA